MSWTRKILLQKDVFTENFFYNMPVVFRLFRCFVYYFKVSVIRTPSCLYQFMQHIWSWLHGHLGLGVLQQVSCLFPLSDNCLVIRREWSGASTPFFYKYHLYSPPRIGWTGTQGWGFHIRWAAFWHFQSIALLLSSNNLGQAHHLFL